MPDITTMQMIALITMSLLIGFSKTGMPSMGMFAVTIAALAFPIKMSVGLILPMLIVGDIVAVLYYKRQSQWRLLITLIPWVIVGIIGGYFTLMFMDNQPLKIMIGVLVLVLVIMQILQYRQKGDAYAHLFQHQSFSRLIGSTAGFATMVGNAAGGIMAIYLLSKKLTKEQFVGTGAWYFLILNLVKVPFSVSLNIIDTYSLTLNLYSIPIILLGTWIGIKLLPKMSPRLFTVLILSLTTVSSIVLIFS